MKALVTFKETELRDLLAFALGGEFCMEVVQANDAEHAISLLRQDVEGFDLLVCGYRGAGEKLIRFAVGQGIQFHFICEAANVPTDPLVYQRKEWIHFVTRAKLIEQLFERVRVLFKDLLTDTRAEKDQFSPVKPYLLTAVSPLPGDVFIRLSETKHIRILRAGDSFDAFDYQYYHDKKKLEFLHVRKSATVATAEQLRTVLLGEPDKVLALEGQIEADLSNQDPRKLLARKIELLKRRARELQAKKAEEAQKKAADLAFTTQGERDAEAAKRTAAEKARALELESKKAEMIKKKAQEILARQADTAKAAAIRSAADRAAKEQNAKLEAARRAQDEALSKELEKDLGAVLENIQDMSNRLGFTREVQEFTKVSVQKTIQGIRKAPKLSRVLSQLRREKEQYISSHSMLLAHLSCALATQLEWTSDTTYQKLTLASFLHDIPLKNQALAAIGSLKELEEKAQQFTPEEVKGYKEHTSVAAEIARGFSEVPPDVDLIIAQHHERPDGSGFPRGLSGSRIGALSTVFIVAHDLVDYLFQHQAVGEDVAGVDLGKFMAANARTYQYANFRKILAAVPQIKT